MMKAYVLPDLNDVSKNKIEFRSKRPSFAICESAKVSGQWIGDIRHIKLTVNAGVTTASLDVAAKAIADAADMAKASANSIERDKRDARIENLKDKLQNFNTLNPTQEKQLLKVLLRSVLIMLSNVNE